MASFKQGLRNDAETLRGRDVAIVIDFGKPDNVAPSALPQDDQALSYPPSIDSKAPAAVARVFEDILDIAEKSDMPGEDSY